MVECLSMRPSGRCSLRYSVLQVCFLLCNEANQVSHGGMFHTHLQLAISPLPVAHGRRVSGLLERTIKPEHVDLVVHDMFLINCRLVSVQTARDGPVRTHTRRRDEEACRDAMVVVERTGDVYQFADRHLETWIHLQPYSTSIRTAPRSLN